jgi:hypothetical protein
VSGLRYGSNRAGATWAYMEPGTLGLSVLIGQAVRRHAQAGYGQVMSW